MWEPITAAWVRYRFPLACSPANGSKGGGAMRDDVCAADLAAVIREAFEEAIPPRRRAPDWDAKWQEIEEWADDADKD